MNWKNKAKNFYVEKNYFDCLEQLYKNLTYTKCWIWGLIIFSLLLDFGLIVLSNHLENIIGVGVGGVAVVAGAGVAGVAGAVVAGAGVAGAVVAGVAGAVVAGAVVAGVAGAVVAGVAGAVGVGGVADYFIKYICKKSLQKLKENGE